MPLSPIVRKKVSKKTFGHQPYTDGPKVKGVFTGISVEVYDSESIERLFENGYGSGAKNIATTSLTNQTECLTLELEESCFLSYFQGVLIICDFKDNEVDWKKFLELAKTVNRNFLECLAAYLYLKAKGWVIKSGIKFGGNFSIYKKGPQFNHASFIILVQPMSESKLIVAKDFKGFQRVSETFHKDILVLEVSKPNILILESIMDIRLFNVSEKIIRRLKNI